MNTVPGTETGRSRIPEDAWELGVDATTSPTPALRGVSRGQEGWRGARQGESLSTALGWFSVGLGAMQLLTPGVVTRMIGVRPTGARSRLMQAMGLREIGHGVGILRNPRSKEWVGTRLGGDVLDLTLLGVALAYAERPGRTVAATAAVLGVGALDLLGTEKLSESRKAPDPGLMELPGAPVRKTITIGRPRGEVYAFWRDLANLPRFMEHLESVEVIDSKRSRWRASGPPGVAAEWVAEIVNERENERISWRSVGSSELYNAFTVHFQDAPGDRGTEVTVEMRWDPPGGRIAVAMLKLFRREPGQQIGDDLRRFKQVMETGDIVLSDATAVSGPHPARPSRRAERSQLA